MKKNKSLFKFIVLFSFLLLWQCNEKTYVPTQPDVTYVELSGTIIDLNTLSPIDSAQITTIPGTKIVYTDTLGKFSIKNIKNGEYVIIVSKIGYLTDSLYIKLKENEKKAISLKLSHDPAFAEILFQTSSDIYTFDDYQYPIIPFYIKNFTDSTISYFKCGGLAVHAFEWKDNGKWKRSGFIGEGCLAILLTESISIMPYHIEYDTLYVVAKDTFRFVIPINRGNHTEFLTSNEFIVQ